VYAVALGTGCTMLLLLLRIAVRRDWAAALLLVPILYLLVGPSLEGAPVLVLLQLFLLVGLLLRLGLLALTAALFTLFLLRYFPLTTDLSAWYAVDTWVAGGIILGMAACGFRTTLAGRPVLGKGLAEDVLG
jgi:hypothetical protein